MSTAFTDNYDIATNRFKAIVDEHISNMTITYEEIRETERLTRGQNKNQVWFDKRRSLLTASNFGKAAKTKVEPSKKLNPIKSKLVPGILLVHYYFIEISHTIYMGMENKIHHHNQH